MEKCALLAWRADRQPIRSFWLWIFVLAGWTGLEPATFGVTSRRSSQLNYHPSVSSFLESFHDLSTIFFKNFRKLIFPQNFPQKILLKKYKKSKNFAIFS